MQKKVQEATKHLEFQGIWRKTPLEEDFQFSFLRKQI